MAKQTEAQKHTQTPFHIHIVMKAVRKHEMNGQIQSSECEQRKKSTRHKFHVMACCKQDVFLFQTVKYGNNEGGCSIGD